MRYSIGYQLPSETDRLPDIVRDYREAVAEVYFALPGEASGRSPLGVTRDGSAARGAAEVMAQELDELARAGVRLVLLFNAACYGDQALSRELADRVRDQVARLRDTVGLDCVTTTSPFVARVIKAAHPEVELRASVNMRLGTPKALGYLADTFDSFYLQREHNRDFARIAELHGWCAEHGKTLHLLANSGCLNFCASQTWHDNAVAHEVGIRQQDNEPLPYPIPCWGYLAPRERWATWLQNSWIRPEDIHHWDAWFPITKLATRMHMNPRMVVAAYAKGRFHGNLLDLMEPGYGPLFADHVIDNRRFPDDWHEATTACDKACRRCGYCEGVLEQVLVRVAEGG